MGASPDPGEKLDNIMKRKITLLLIFLSGILCAGAQTDSLSLKMIGHAHIDFAYRWRWNETTDHVIFDTFDGVLKMMEKEPGLTFAQSQLALYEYVQKNNQGLFQRIKQQINKGTWSVVGNQWCEMDEAMPGGESLIRQILIGSGYIRKNLQIPLSDIVWSPDAFSGKVNTLPQIYAGCGMKYFVFMRHHPKGKRIFWWESPDGSRILAYNTPGAYNNRIDSKMIKGVTEWYEDAKYNEALVLYGEGDHGGGPRSPDIEGIHSLKEKNIFGEISYGSPGAYFEKLAQNQWPTWKKEMGIGKENRFTGCFTSHARLKQANREIENSLLVTERFAFIGSQLQGKPFFPRIDFREAWKVLLRNQFHDVLPGTCIGSAADDAMLEYGQLKKSVQSLLDFGLENIGNRINTKGEGIPVIVYNPLSWTRSAYVKADINFIAPPDEFCMVNAQNKKVPFEIVDKSEDGLKVKLNFWAADILPVGYSMFRIIEGTPENFTSNLKLKGKNTAENEFYRVTWDKNGMSGLYDKTLKKELLSGIGNRLQLYEEISSSSWRMQLGKQVNIHSLGAPVVIKKSPLEIVVQWKDRSEESTFTREMVLKAGSPVIDFKIKVNWHDRDKYLQVAFPCKLKDGIATYEQPFGAISRKQGEWEYPAQNWVDLSGDRNGITFINTARYGFGINNNTIHMSVLRSARDMDPRMDEGEHIVNYSIYAHQGDWKEGKTPQKAFEVNQPLIAKQENKHKGETSGWTSKMVLPAKYSFYGTDSDHAIISALKVQEGDWNPQNLILRIYETEAREDTIKVTLPAKPAKVMETNHIEHPLLLQPELTIDGKSFSFFIKPNQIRTFLIGF